MIRSMSTKDLTDFVFFVTGSTLLNQSSFQGISVGIIQLEEGEKRKFPFASTCMRTVIFYLDSLTKTTKQESLKTSKKNSGMP